MFAVFKYPNDDANLDQFTVNKGELVTGLLQTRFVYRRILDLALRHIFHRGRSGAAMLMDLYGIFSNRTMRNQLDLQSIRWVSDNEFHLRELIGKTL